MGLLDTIKSVLGLGSDETTSSPDGTDVTVEYEPDTDSESAVKGVDPEPTDESADADDARRSGGATDDTERSSGTTPGEPIAAGTDAAASTGSMTEEPPDTPEEAAESAEAAGPESQVEEPVPGDATPVTEISGIGSAYGERLENAGISSVEELAGADPEAVAEETDLSPKRVGDWVERAAERTGDT